MASPEIGEILSRRPVLADGAMGTELLARGFPLGRCYEEMNVSEPGVIGSIHEAYLEAGAEIVETNTFGANRVRLGRHGLANRVAEINAAGVRLAREAVESFRKRRASEERAGEAWVAGSMGPLGVGLAAAVGGEAREVFLEQARALVAAGVEMLVVETMTGLDEAREALLAAREAGREAGLEAGHEGGQGLPIVAMMTVNDGLRCLDGTPAQDAARMLTELGASAVGVNCSTGPEAVLAAIEAMRAATRLPLAAMPNAGLPRMVEGREVYAVSPEQMAAFAREAIQAGARIVGGCCGTTQEHIRVMREAVGE